MSVPLEQSQKVRKLAQDYMLRSGMAPADLARHIGFAYSTTRLFLTGKYANLCHEAGVSRAILEFLERNPLAAAESFTGKIYETGAVKTIRQVFAQLLDRPRLHAVRAAGLGEDGHCTVPDCRAQCEVEPAADFPRILPGQNHAARPAAACGLCVRLRSAHCHRASNRQSSLRVPR
jgi:hypothetical protein